MDRVEHYFQDGTIGVAYYLGSYADNRLYAVALVNRSGYTHIVRNYIATNAEEAMARYLEFRNE